MPRRSPLSGEGGLKAAEKLKTEKAERMRRSEVGGGQVSPGRAARTTILVSKTTRITSPERGRPALPD